MKIGWGRSGLVPRLGLLSCCFYDRASGIKVALLAGEVK